MPPVNFWAAAWHHALAETIKREWFEHHIRHKTSIKNSNNPWRELALNNELNSVVYYHMTQLTELFEINLDTTNVAFLCLKAPLIHKTQSCKLLFERHVTYECSGFDCRFPSRFQHPETKTRVMPSRTERIRAATEKREQQPSRRASRGNGSCPQPWCWILPNAPKIRGIYSHTCPDASNQVL